jgi:hypothetical protein
VIFVMMALAVSEFLFGIRILNSLLNEQKIKTRTKLCIETVFFVSWPAVGLLFPLNLRSVFLLSVFWQGFFLILQKFSRLARERRFREESEAFLDRVVLNLLSGDSFRSSCMAAAKLGDAFSQQETQKILAHVFFKQHQSERLSSRFALFLEKQLESIDLHPHSALTRVRGLRRNLALESEFRQKSDQVRGRVWVQAVFMLGLYLAMVIFVFRQRSAVDSSSLLVSVTFFVTGFAWTLLDGRKMKWKT